MTAIILPFRLKVSGSDNFEDFAAVSTSYRFNGMLRLSDDVLDIEWGGVAQVQEVGTLDMRDEKIPLPDEDLSVPVSSLYSAKLAGGWWRPRVVIVARDRNALSIVPSEDHGTVNFWYARSDGQQAHQLVTRLTDAISRALSDGRRD